MHVSSRSLRFILLGLFACKPEVQLPPIDLPDDPTPPETSFFPGPTLVGEMVFADVDGNIRYDVAHYCDQMVTRHAVVRAVDMVDGGLRWRCGDIPGNDGTGQEYCEYSVFSNGAVITDASLIDQAEPLYCVFTSVFNDTPDKDPELAAALALPENLGAVVSDLSIVRMQQEGFNARIAANGLIDSCSTATSTLGDERQAACFNAARKAFDANDLVGFEQIETACRNQDLTDEDRWAFAQFVGVKEFVEGEDGFQQQREINSCMVAAGDFGPFIDALQSDETICGRTFRAGTECGCSWNDIPESLDGFLFTEWLTPTNFEIPAECRLAKVGGVDYPHLMLCEVPAADAANLPNDAQFAQDLKSFCNERFGKKIGVLAPLRAIEIPGTCRADTEFCSAFTGQ
jgi:hypothetical protein